MKREGYRHAMVRSHKILPSPWDPKPNSKLINKVDSPPIAGVYVKMSSKSNNHSKFTGKCGQRARCKEGHVHPSSKSRDKGKDSQKLKSSKSRDKGKGSQKLKSSKMAMDHRSLAWRVAGDKEQGSDYSAISATDILCHMSSDDCFDVAV